MRGRRLSLLGAGRVPLVTENSEPDRRESDMRKVTDPALQSATFTAPPASARPSIETRGVHEMFDSQSEEAAYSSIAFLHGIPASAHSSERPRRPSGPVRRVAPEDPAVHVMTDFSAEPAVTVAPDRLIDDALRDMIVAGVRALLVVRGELIVGLITSYDIQGERPLQFLSTSGFTRHDEIQVDHIMTPWEKVPTLDARWVNSACVGDIVHSFKAGQASHVVVVEYAKHSGVLVRGLFSRTQLERQLGRSI